MTENAKRWAQLHDEMLSYDIEILEKTEKLGELRDRMYRTQNKKLMQNIAGLCDELADAAEAYKDWLEDWEDRHCGEFLAD